MTTYKDIKGKYVRALPEITKKINIIIVGIFFAIPLVLLVLLEDKFMPLVFFCGMVFAFGRLFLPGRVLAVLADDRIHYFSDDYRVDFAEVLGFKKTVYSTNGWISYRAIRRVEFSDAKKSHFPTVTLYGDDFELRLRCVGSGLAREIEKRCATATHCMDGLYSAAPRDEIEREGLWRKMWEYLETCDPAAVIGYHDANIQFEMYADREMDSADIWLPQNGDGREINVSFDKDGVYVFLDKGDDKILEYKDVEDVSAVLEWIRTAISEN